LESTMIDPGELPWQPREQALLLGMAKKCRTCGTIVRPGQMHVPPAVEGTPAHFMVWASGKFQEGA